MQRYVQQQHEQQQHCCSTALGSKQACNLEKKGERVCGSKNGTAETFAAAIVGNHAQGGLLINVEIINKQKGMQRSILQQHCLLAGHCKHKIASVPDRASCSRLCMTCCITFASRPVRNYFPTHFHGDITAQSVPALGCLAGILNKAGTPDPFCSCPTASRCP